MPLLFRLEEHHPHHASLQLQPVLPCLVYMWLGVVATTLVLPAVGLEWKTQAAESHIAGHDLDFRALDSDNDLKLSVAECRTIFDVRQCVHDVTLNLLRVRKSSAIASAQTGRPFPGEVRLHGPRRLRLRVFPWYVVCCEPTAVPHWPVF